MRRTYLAILFFVIFIIGARELLFYKLSYIHHPEAIEQTSDDSSFDIKEFLSKPMHFIGMGSQCIVFAPKNSPYVLKMCKATRYQNLFSPSKTKIERLKKDCQNYITSFKDLKSQTAIVYLHLNKSSFLKKEITLIDPFHIPYSINADEVLFYVQKKATPFTVYLKTASQKQRDSLFFHLMQSIVDAATKGVRIKDIQPQKNIGIVDALPVWIDPGRMEKKEFSTKEIELLLLSMRSRLAPFLSVEELQNLSTDPASYH